MPPKGFPVVIVSKNGRPVISVENNGQLATVAANGLGEPITLVTKNGEPMIIQGLTPPPFVFTDNFNRANGNLESDPNWTRIGGTAGMAAITSNIVGSTTSVSTGAAYLCPDIGKDEMYVQAAWEVNTGTVNCGIAARLVDNLNYILLRWNTAAAGVQINSVAAGAFTTLGSFPGAIAIGDVLRMEIKNDTVRALKNGVQIIAPVSLAGKLAGTTRAGLVPRASIIAAWLDNFEAGAL